MYEFAQQGLWVYAPNGMYSDPVISWYIRNTDGRPRLVGWRV